MRRLARLVALGAMLAPGLANAQALFCAVPNAVPRPNPDLPSAREPQRIVPIGSYTLALTWGPGFCRKGGFSPAARFQCGSGNRFGFTLHGLWPDGVGREWPQYCTATPLVPPAVIKGMMCATPSAQLIQHEWAKHGTCMGTTPAAYFARSNALFAKIRYPDMDRLSRGALTVGQFKRAFSAMNPGIPTTSVRVTASRGWLDELWLCLDKSFAYARCRAGTGGLPDNAGLKIWRGRR